MPKKGDLLYTIENGNLQTVKFIEESFSTPECTETTYVLKYADRKFRCSKDMYVESPELAWKRYYEQLQNALSEAEHNLTVVQAHLQAIQKESERVKGILNPKELTLTQAQKRLQIAEETWNNYANLPDNIDGTYAWIMGENRWMRNFTCAIYQERMALHGWFFVEFKPNTNIVSRFGHEMR
jgi:hypothetical protein